MKKAKYTAYDLDDISRLRKRLELIRIEDEKLLIKEIKEVIK